MTARPDSNGGSPGAPSRDPGAPRPPRARVLVTGASRRVGRATVLELAHAGVEPVLTFRAREDECRATAREAEEAARAAGFAVEPLVLRLDLCDTASVDAFLAALAPTVERRGLDAIVHNASDYIVSPLDACDRPALAALMDRAHRAEAVAPATITLALRGALAKSAVAGGGAVVFFSDIYALGKPRAGYLAYTVAKAGVRAMAEQLAVELAPEIRVHCVAPGVVAWAEGMDEATKAAVLSRTPLGRAGTPEDAAKLVRFLILEAPYLTGGTIAVDGGRSLR